MKTEQARAINKSMRSLFLNRVNSRESLNVLLKTNYDKFYSERVADQQIKSTKAAI